LMWRWVAQTAIREGNWKLLRGGDREYLFDLKADPQEKHNLAKVHPEIAARLRQELAAWCDELNPPGLSTGPMASVWHAYFDFYLEGKPVSLPGLNAPSHETWIARNAQMVVENGYLRLKPDQGSLQKPFLTCTGLSLQGPVTVTLILRADQAGEATLAWRRAGESDFLPENRMTVHWERQAGDVPLRVVLPVQGRLIHIRILPQPFESFALRGVTLEGQNGQRRTWDFAVE